MSKVLARRGLWSAYRIVLLQAAIAGGTSIFFFALWGAQYGFSALAGGLIAVLPNFVFATLAFSHAGARASRKVVWSFFLGEAVKLLLTIVLFACAFGLLNTSFMPLFISYLLALLIPWTAPLYFKQN
ncbi:MULTISPECIES: ATP synthase subunit I [unclassified Shewanella]|uniref:ATP synthase subunit I n=1 Tax=unclassified Shewanella TaxID=196818 RepID=UPI000C839AB1|nr:MULTISPECIES: ATP synthase subunit I [unclassified Shewanella]MDO6679027.1 ATP synthase subunit I [Shewanella sp. 4_MG-2023]MDO6776025.1 ATP synthase subunit I [Shewanella sp. 3_MG-2023]PMG30855.1 F0F1 ATP synthase subunit I [Shewanella sp. 10N.286.52.C2]PMG51181.1 F0F1 ATP synthase subunit I [Shewanella sp. 10N.286.52.B9]PMH88605.1 F0F1 ATP synthase subunit I [Shewanella sp. 10N.286.48.B5]